MPTSPRLLKPPEPSRHRTVAKAERERAELEQARGSASSRGYDRKWRAFRAAHLAEHPLCVRCLSLGLVVPAAELDHIEPHRGNKELFWRPGNHQGLCRPCHSRKTVMEDGGWNRGAQSHPEFLAPALLPVTLVCGPACSGKSSYVRELAREGDVVLDLDVIASAIAGTGLHEWPASVLGEALRERNRRLLELSDPAWCSAHGGAAVWLILSEPLARWRDWWRVKLGVREVVVLEADRRTCIDRARAERPDWRTTAQAIDEWWSVYQRSDHDLVLKP